MSVRLPRGVRRLFRLGMVRPEVECDLDDEIAFHLEEAVRDLMAEGVSREEALDRARAAFGDERAYRRALARIDAERVRGERRWAWWELATQAVRSFVASVARTPLLTVGIVATLALGIGVDTTMYGIVDRVLLQPPRHIRDADRVYRALLARPRGRRGLVLGDLSVYPVYRDLRVDEGLALAAFTPPVETTIGAGADASDAQVASASAGFFPLLGVTAARGRFFTETETAPGADLTVVVGEEYWRRAFGADPDVLGRRLEIAGHAHRVIGVAPAGFTGIDVRRVDLWVPLEATHALGRFNCLDDYRCSWMHTVARLPEGASVEAVAADATAFLRNRARELGDPRADELRVSFGSIVPGRGIDAPAESRLALWLAGLSLVVLLVACANVVSLLAARSVRRRSEVAVRIALGAGRRRVVGQALVESVGLALVGGGVALLVARWGGAIVRSTLLPDVSFPDAALTPRVLAFTGVAALLGGLAAGIGPALQASRADPARDLGSGALGNSSAHSPLFAITTNAQVALCVVLLVGAGLFIQSMRQVRAADLGLDVGHMLEARLELREAATPDAEVLTLYDEAARRVASLPGVRATTHAEGLIGFAMAAPLQIPDVDSIPSLPGGGPYVREVKAGFFEATGIAIVRGRPIETSDGARAAVVNETMARTLWPGDDPLGRCLLLFEEKVCTPVVGVAENVAQTGYRDPPFMEVYVPTPPDAGVLARALYVRTDGRPEDVEADVARLLRTFSPRVRNARVRTLLQVLDPQVRAWRMGAVLLTLFGVLATTLAALGLYAALAFDVERRRRSLGIRSALGAGSTRLLAQVVGRGGRLTGVGLTLGLGASWWAAPHIQGVLYRVAPRDPLVLVGVAALLLAVTLAGSLLPGLHATRVDPAETLRSE